jgi:thiosulfate/3-mercaptopyruvate sulfurtransferase
MPHTHYTTLISAANLAERLAAAPGSVAVFDCRFDLADPAAGEAAYAAGHIPGAQYLHLDRDLSGRKTGTNGRHPLPSRDALASLMASRGVKQGQQVVAYDAHGGAYAARLGGCCAGSGTTPWRCSTAVCRHGRRPASR